MPQPTAPNPLEAFIRAHLRHEPGHALDFADVHALFLTWVESRPEAYMVEPLFSRALATEFACHPCGGRVWVLDAAFTEERPARKRRPRTTREWLAAHVVRAAGHTADFASIFDAYEEDAQINGLWRRDAFALRRTLSDLGFQSELGEAGARVILDAALIRDDAAEAQNGSIAPVEQPLGHDLDEPDVVGERARAAVSKPQLGIKEAFDPLAQGVPAARIGGLPGEREILDQAHHHVQRDLAPLTLRISIEIVDPTAGKLARHAEDDSATADPRH